MLNMKYLNHKLISIAMLGLAISACTDKYECNYRGEKPEDVAISEYLASFDVLKSYIKRDAESSFKFLANMSASDFTAHETAYGTVITNFDGLDIGKSFMPMNTPDGNYDFSGMQLVADAAQKANVTLFGGTLCSNQDQTANYYKQLIEPVVIPFVPEKGKTVILDFENDMLGATYSMTNGSSAVVENDPDNKSGKALHVGSDANKAAYSFPKFHVKLPAGRTLGDYVNITFDMRIVNQDGLWGSGMFITIDGQKFPVGVNAEGLGCNPNVWNRGAIVKLNSSTAPGFELPDNLKSLTEFDLALGSESSGAQYYLDNIVMNYEMGSGVVKFDFESDANGKTYQMTGNGSATVVSDPYGNHGNVLHIAGPASYSYPKFKIKLPENHTLSECRSVSLDFYGTSSTGLYGSGMRLAIEGVTKEFVLSSPANLGCPDGGWGDGLISLNIDLSEVSAENRQLNEFTLIVGSGTGSGDYYIDNVCLNWKGEDTVLEKTPEEKTEIFTAELTKWIGGMINAGGETVNVWNIIGEPLDETVNENTFNWGEYLGELDYARKAVEIARDTATVDLKLFVSNTFEQEDNMLQKINDLVTLVQSWEGDNKTKIDGYNILLHAVYSENIDVRTENKRIITELFEALNQTQKLVRISDLSIVVKDIDGNLVPISKLTADERIAAGNYLSFIMQEYQRIIDAKNQYGISISCITDNDNSYKVCPWTSGYNRNEMYEGIVNGLKQE